jgi:hypothetical protein
VRARERKILLKFMVSLHATDMSVCGYSITQMMRDTPASLRDHFSSGAAASWRREGRRLLLLLYAFNCNSHRNMSLLSQCRKFTHNGNFSSRPQDERLSTLFLSDALLGIDARKGEILMCSCVHAGTVSRIRLNKHSGAR